MPSFSSGQINQLKKLWKNKDKPNAAEDAAATSTANSNKNSIFYKKPKNSPPDTSIKAGGLKRKRNSSHCDVESLSNSIAEESKKRLAMTQFRHMNQYLYTNNSKSAVGYMDPDKFNEYHKAYSKIASGWPVRPIDVIIDKIKQIKRKKIVIADIGCGSVPLIAENVANALVHSFDLVSLDERVTVADATNIPLNDSSVDVVVYSLSLMATDINLQIAEGTRVLKQGGSMFIAEVTSRFDLSKDPAQGESEEHQNSSASKSTSTLQANCLGSDAGIKSFVRVLGKHYSLHKAEMEQLPPNNYFTLMHFKKKGSIKKPLVSIELRPCVYKPR